MIHFYYSIVTPKSYIFDDFPCVEELTVGDFIAIPVDVTTSTGKLTSWTPRLVLSDALEAGIKIEDDSIQAENLVALGGDVITGYNDETTYYGMANIYTKKLGNN